MKIKFRKNICLYIGLTAILATACSEQDVPDVPDNGQQPYSIAIAVEGNSLVSSRTSVVDPDDNLQGKQHVTRVHLYIYKAEDGDYTCVAKEDVNWNHLEGAMDGLETREKYYSTKYQEYEDGVNYLFMAVGFDDTYTGDEKKPVYDGKNSVEAFGTPEKIVGIGDKLSGGSFALQNDKRPEHIAKSELFAGSRIFTKEQLKGFEATKQPIELYRRVAGVVGYFKNLPKTYNEETVHHVSLCLYTPQNTKTHFLPLLPDGYTSPQAVPDEKYADFIDSPYSEENGMTVSSINATEVNKDGTFCLSSYVLPIAASKAEGQSTLALVLYGANGKELAKRRVLYDSTPVNVSRSGTGIIDVPEDATDSKYMHYPLRANHFYRMGSKDTPIDLSGQTAYIYLELDPVWDEYYGGTIDNPQIPGIGIDKDWGNHDGGKID